MNPRERGFLLLTSRLGDPERRPLSPARLRTLASRVCEAIPEDPDRELVPDDLTAMGFDPEFARRIQALLQQEHRLEAYVRRAKQFDCVPVTRVSPDYPALLRRRLGLDSPGCFWAKGDLAILHTPALSLVGSRELQEPNRAFAARVGVLAARQGLTLVSGNARGADRTAQEACLEAGGQVISIVADDLRSQPLQKHVLYLSQEDYDEAFSVQRALSRNRSIHAWGAVTFVAQADLGKGGTWDGTVKNLRCGWTPVACFQDGSESARRLEDLGAFPLTMEELEQLRISEIGRFSLFDP